jgi:hypothetical protein
MRSLLTIPVLLLLSTAAMPPAHANQIISFGQVPSTNTVTAIANLAGTQTTITIDNAPVLIDQLEGVITPPAIPALMDLTATSTDAATGVGPALLQHYSGSFCISAGGLCSGTIDLRGTFSDAAFGLATGSQLSVNVSDPPDALSLFSTVIPSADLVPPSSFTLSMSNILPDPPGLALDNLTLASFTASFSGVANATPAPVVEASALSILLVGLVGMAWAKHHQRRRQRVARRLFELAEAPV